MIVKVIGMLVLAGVVMLGGCKPVVEAEPGPTDCNMTCRCDGHTFQVDVGVNCQNSVAMIGACSTACDTKHWVKEPKPCPETKVACCGHCGQGGTAGCGTTSLGYWRNFATSPLSWDGSTSGIVIGGSDSSWTTRR